MALILLIQSEVDNSAWTVFRGKGLLDTADEAIAVVREIHTVRLKSQPRQA